MRLYLVPKPVAPAYDFDPEAADLNVPIPVDARQCDPADAPTGATPRGLGHLRAWLSDVEDEETGATLTIALADMTGDPGAAVVPLMTAYHAETLVGSVFAQWRAGRPRRASACLICESCTADAMPSLAITLARRAG